MPVEGGLPVDLADDVFMGHEFSAEVLEAGPDTDAPPPGTVVTSLPVLLSPKGFEPILSSNTTIGGYAERMLLSAPLLLTIPNGLDPRHAVAHRADGGRPARGEQVVGPARRVGAGDRVRADRSRDHRRAAPARRGKHCGCDYSHKRRELATTMGAHQTVDPAQGSPFDDVKPAVVFEAVGVPGIVNDVMRRAPMGTRLVVAGVCMEPDTVLPLFGIAKEINVQFVNAYDHHGVRRVTARHRRGRDRRRPADHRRGRPRRRRRRIRRPRQPRRALQNSGNSLAASLNSSVCRASQVHSGIRVVLLALRHLVPACERLDGDQRRLKEATTHLEEAREDRLARRIADLYANDPQFRKARPIPDVIEAGKQARPAAGRNLADPGRRLCRPPCARPTRAGTGDGHHNRPHLRRACCPVSRRSATASYGTESARSRPHCATTPPHPVNPGDFVATIGFASPDYFTVDLACAYLGLVSVPLQHNAPVSQLQADHRRDRAEGARRRRRSIWISPSSRRWRAPSLRHLLVFDFDPAVDDHRENLERAQARLSDAGMPVTVDTLADVIERGRTLPPEPAYTGGSDDRLAMIMYTSGSTGAPKGAMMTERTVAQAVDLEVRFDQPTCPVFNVNFMPLNHLGGRLPLVSSFLAGGTSYFVPESDLSTLFEDWALVRPTDMALVPRVVDMLFQRYRSAVDRLVADGSTGEPPKRPPRPSCAKRCSAGG